MVVKNFRQLQAEMGHSNPMPIQSYLDEAGRYQKEESIFFEVEAKNPVEQERNTAHKSAHYSPSTGFVGRAPVRSFLGGLGMGPLGKSAQGIPWKPAFVASGQ